MKIHALASTRHYARHLRAIWQHLDPRLQGNFYAGREPTSKRAPMEDVVLVAGFYDIARAPQRIVYVEHGAGQNYGGDERTAGHPCYHGANHPGRVIGYVSPNQRVADSWGRPAIACGVPALDHLETRSVRFQPDRVAAITFHFDARGAFVAPEAWSAREHYIEMLHTMVAELRCQGFEVLGTWHPKDPMGPNIWRNLQVDHTSDPDEVLTRAHLLIADNTSLLYEAAALGIPSIVLNAPWYRRSVEHGLRFWSHVPGRMVESPEEFVGLDFKSYLNETAPYRVAASAAEHAYGPRRRDAGVRAARWIEKLVGGEV